MSNVQQVADWVLEIQRKTRECPKVWMVYVRCDGEDSVEALYESKEAADMHCEWYNRKPRYYGKARVVSSAIRTLEIARLLTGDTHE